MLDGITNNTNLIARPNALAIDGIESRIFIGDVIRYIESITSSQNGVTVKTAALEVGVKLNVLPRIGDDGTITMMVNPVVSFLKSFTPVPGGGQLPQTSERSATNTLAIKSGETIAIGGLIQHQDTVNVSGLPILKDLPLIGRLFSRTENIRQKKEVVIFLTARVIEGPATSETAKPIEKSLPNGGGGK
jgi:general secretion pathway protein D